MVGRNALHTNKIFQINENKMSSGFDLSSLLLQETILC